VQDLDPSGRRAIARKLGTDLATETVAVTVAGTRWSLAFTARDEDEAERIAQEIAVSRRRHAGLLLNPNYQGATVTGVERLTVEHVE